MEKKTRILFVDDEAFVLDALHRLFKDDGYSILLAGSAKSALEILRNAPAHVIVSDYRMPGMNGSEFLTTVAEEWPDTVRLILSGHADISSVVSAINDGQIYKFISKPWNNDELREVIRDSVERYWDHHALHALAAAVSMEHQSLLAGYISEFDRLKRQERHENSPQEITSILEVVFQKLLGPVLIFRDDELVWWNQDALSFVAIPSNELYEDSEGLLLPGQLLNLVSAQSRSAGINNRSSTVLTAGTRSIPLEIRCHRNSDGVLVSLVFINEKS
jgi:FixJ family two-component response regulator